jgi:hypothetical protein
MKKAIKMNALKTIFSVGIISLIIFFLGSAIYLNGTTEKKLSELEARVSLADKKKDFYSTTTVSVERLNANLETQIALEKDQALQLELQRNLTALQTAIQQKALANDQKKLLDLQAKADQEKARLAQIQKEQALALAQVQATATTSSSTSSSSGSTKSTTPKPAPAPKPPKTKAS